MGADISSPMYAIPGKRVVHLDQLVDKLLEVPFVNATVSLDHHTVDDFRAMARSLGRNSDPLVRAALARLWSAVEIHRIAAVVAGPEGERGAANQAKIRLAELYRIARDVGGQILGPWAGLIDPTQLGGDL